MSKLFATNLRYFREQAQMTQEDLARQARVSRSMIANYENARTEPAFENLCLISAALGVDITDLITEQPQPQERQFRKIISEEEAILIDAYRLAEPTYQTVALDILKAHRKEEKS